ncbi:metal ABC transporter solute-binding protein, Zn/Mn family [Fredinandcohnia onubensis]|uniref:metal ABC transporter solute-binding protein, Zn/Mn family n=1 Tax=Fredinandcohnia onubensis TaxID=1571209 RepID=UPI000C0BF6FB|nr:zinc ABC transporter substrate-binding protein [Fredinandcohnia onubensis]
MKIRHVIAFFVLLATTFLFGCVSENKTSTTEVKNTPTPSERLKIYTTVFPLQDFTEKIGGEHVEVLSVFPTGADAHTFEPTTKTMVGIAEADALIYVGAGVEGFIDAAIKTLENEKVQLVKATGDMELLKAQEEHEVHDDETEHDHHQSDSNNEESHSHDEHDEHEGQVDSGSGTEDHHHHGDVDPHVWLDPLLAVELAENILHTLEELKPETKKDFEKNFDELVKNLHALDQEFMDVVNESSRKEILVSHAAYGYWESRYGIKQISVSGLSPTNEPTQKDLTHIINLAKEHNIKFVLFEQNLTSKVSEMVKKEINAEALTLHNLESATEEDIKNSADYFSIMRQNLETLKKALH